MGRYSRLFESAVAQAPGVKFLGDNDFTWFIREIEEVTSIVESLGDTPSPEAMQRLERLRKDEVLPIEPGESPARDAQYELLLYSILQKGGLQPTLGTPDITVLTAEGTVTIEAKRPKRQARVEERVREAGEVLRDEPAGLIALSLDLVIWPYPTMVVGASEAEVVERIMRDFQHWGAAHSRGVCMKASSRGVRGVLFTAAAPAFEADAGMPVTLIHLSIDPNRTEPSQKNAFQAVKDAIGRGLAQGRAEN